MAFRINTNVMSLNAHQIGTTNNRNIGNSLEKLSSGLRINKAADDASGMAIADSLRSQANSLNQAIKNANDGIGIIQIADKAMDEQVKILDTVKTKLVQSANDSQNSDSREAIERDIQKLLKSFQNITNTTSFNGQNLLAGMFTDKKFQIGASANETINVDISSNLVSKVGNTSFKTTGIVKGSSTEHDFGETSLTFKNVDGLKDVTLESVTIGSQAGEGLGALAEVINKNSDKTGIKAHADVEYKYSDINQISIKSGTTDSGFKINGVTIGSVEVQDNDKSGSLVSAINSKTDKTGVTSWMNESGELVMKSDGRAIVISSDDMANLSTMGIAKSSSVAINERGDTTYQLANGQTKSGLTSQPSGAYILTIPKNITNLTLNLNDHGANDTLQIFSKSGAHLVGTADGDSSWTSGNSPIDIVKNNSDLFCDDATYDDTYLNTGGPNDSTPLDSEYHSMGIGYTGDHNPSSLNETLTIDNVTEELLVFVNGSGAFTLGASWTNSDAGVDSITIGELELVKQNSSTNIEVEGTNLDLVGLSEDDYASSYVKNLQDVTAIYDEERLGDMSCRDVNGIQDSISIVESAIYDVDKNRGNLGSTQNQLISTINNISVTAVNVKASESQIRDVDFADESANFQKSNILAQAGSYAMSQANQQAQAIQKFLQ
jgi:flagellin